MEKKHQVHNLIILDESGSMESIKSSIITGFNELVQTIQGIEKQFPDQEHFITFQTFNGLRQKMHHFMEPVSKLNQIDEKKYLPDASTPLFDAMGFSINKLKNALQNQTDYNVLVTIMTDGEENASREFSGNDIKKIIEGLKQNRWTFTYIGTEHDVKKIASTISINNTLQFEKNETDIKIMFSKDRKSREIYSEKILKKEDTSGGYFEDSEITSKQSTETNSNPTPQSGQSLFKKLFGSR